MTPERLAASPLAVDDRGAIAEAEDRPNIVLVVTDDMRDSDWRALAQTRQLIAERGAWFPNFFLTTPICSPSRTSILTGMYTHNHGVVANSGKRGGEAQFKQGDLGEKAIGTRLRARGYRTGLFGKFMNGSDEKGGVPGGWDRWLVTSEQDYKHPIMNDNGKRREFKKHKHYSTDLLRARAAEFIRTTGDSQPLLCVFTPKAPHNPATPAKRDRGKFAGAQVERSPDINEADVSDKPGYIRRRKFLSGRRLDDLERRRLETLIAVDDAVMNLVAVLEDEGRFDNTYLFVLSDNGWMMGSHRWESKGAPYRNATQVAMGAIGPGFAAGATDQRLAANIDITATIAAVTGADMPWCDGVSLLGGTRDDVLLECFQGGPPYRALRTAQRLYVENGSGNERELYEYADDPYELDNLLASWNGHTPVPGAETTAAGMKARLDALRDCAGDTCR